MNQIEQYEKELRKIKDDINSGRVKQEEFEKLLERRRELKSKIKAIKNVESVSETVKPEQEDPKEPEETGEEIELDGLDSEEVEPAE